MLLTEQEVYALSVRLARSHTRSRADGDVDCVQYEEARVKESDEATVAAHMVVVRRAAVARGELLWTQCAGRVRSWIAWTPRLRPRTRHALG